MKKLILTTIIFLFASFVSAYCCANPLSFDDICFENNYTKEFAQDVCCQGSEYYGTSPRFPKSKEDCLANFFHENCDRESCDLGCCYDVEMDKCLSYIPKSQCNGVLNIKLNGSCKIDGMFAIAVCEPGCCCNDYGFSLTTERGCDGEFMGSVSSERTCEFICQANYCTEGCQAERPFFCKEDGIIEDCTGGDGIVGNENDCGCEPGKECTSSGKCKKSTPLSSYKSVKKCNEKGFLWCEEENYCVSSCSRCSSSKREENLCVDACKDVQCGENSECIDGECVCNQGFYDEVCRAYDTKMDFDRDGCYRITPCENEKSNSSWWILGIVAIVILLILFMKRGRKKKVEENPQQPYWQKYPPQGFQRPPY